jgi:TfoX/Sxy family transcriptional regulator of competence genes
MAWVKIPAEHHPLFRAALPKDPRIQTLQMFGGVAGKVNGKMFGGLFGRSVVVRLGQADRAEALALDGAEPFDPMGHGPSKDMVLLPEDLIHDEEGLRAWLVRAIRSTASLAAAPKAKKPAAKKPAAKKPAAKAAAKKPTARPAARSPRR